MEAATATKPVTFEAKRPHHILTLVPVRVKRNHENEIIWTNNAPYDAEDNPNPSVRVEFGSQGPANDFTTDDPRVIDKLREHELYNKDFWEQGAPPDLPKPTVAQQMSAITAAAVKGDIETLKEIAREEQDTHNREEVLLAIKSAAEAIAEG